ncbi:MAG: [protein-PII] uridylyltransferase [Actinobacteria bacterium]|nr:[protein-PII] uridylyltransferase [Actinomycetota bacterium]
MADVAAELRASGEELRERDLTVAGAARAWRRDRTMQVDEALGRLIAGVELPQGRVAVVATGGYGRGELCPGSDIDLLLLVDQVDDADLDGLVKAVVYPLWDAGLTVGHAVRTSEEAVELALGDVDIATATLDARTVAGPSDLTARTRAALIAELQRRPARFLDALAARDAERRIRYGDVAEVLEPELKEGAGGLRDVQSLRWAAAALLGDPALDPLVAAGYLSAADRTRLARAYATLLDVRVALHLDAGHGTDRLIFQRQDPVAGRLGRGGDGASLLHDLFLTARTIDHVHRAAWAVIGSDLERRDRRGRLLRRRTRPVRDEVAPGFAVGGGVLRLTDPTVLREPDLPVRLLEALAVADVALDRRSAGTIARAAVGATRDRWRWSEDARRRFLHVLWQGSTALPAVGEFDDLGLLTTMIPEWEPVRGRPQRNPYHRYSLDRHAFRAVAALADEIRHEPWAVARLEQVEDRDALILGTLLHDVGKAYGEPHSETGAPVASGIARRMGADSSTRETVSRLVRLHLLLPETATRRDLTDGELIRDVADTIGDRSLLASLHLLAVADGSATGPSAWSRWKATLVAELVGKVEQVMAGAGTDDVVDGAVDTAAEAQRVAPEMGVDPDVVRAHLAELPARYAASVSARAVVRHAGAAATPLAPSEVRPRVTPAEHADGPHEHDDLDVVARDRPGLFAKVAGVLALHGGSIVSAHAFTRSDGIAVDTFQVRRPEDVASGRFWAAVEGDLVEAVAGRLALRARVDRRASSFRQPRPVGPAVPVRVEIETDAGGRSTVVEVHAEDGVGVLFRIVTALAELELDIVAARVDTVGREVVDVFYVRDAEGQPLDEDHAHEVVLAVQGALAQTSSD